MADRSRDNIRDGIKRRHGQRRRAFAVFGSGRQGGFSIIELVLVILIIGLIASIMIPNLIDALHKAKQRRTMAELKLIGMAWMNWLTDQAGTAAAGARQTYPMDGFQKLDYAEIYRYLHPSDTFFYMQTIPENDPWGAQLDFYQNENLLTDNQLLICAAARNLFFDTCDGTTDIPMGPFIATDFDQDIVWADGYLVRWPDIRTGPH